MQQSSSSSSSSSKFRQFDHERLEVYQMELSFVEWVTMLLDEVKASRGSRIAEVCDQLDRASLSALLNTAEANGRRQRLQRAKGFDDARGSATECAACLDALIAKGLCNDGRISAGKEMLFRIVSMLTKLVDRFESSEFRDETVEYKVSFQKRTEDEDEEDEDERKRP